MAAQAAVSAGLRRGLAGLCGAAWALLASSAHAQPAPAQPRAPAATASAAAEGPWCAPPRVLRETARDDFRDDGGLPGDALGRWRWRLEAERGESLVSVGDAAVLDVQTPAGLSLWWRQPLQGDYEIRFEARALPAPDSAGALAGRISDLNLFWNASEADGQAPRPRDGRFASHDSLRTYYLGYGANGNRSTRLRHYNGLGLRSVLNGWADAPEAGPDDRQGPMTAATRLVAGQWISVTVASYAPSTPGGVHGHVDINGQRLFTLAQAQPLLQGHFAFRTTASRWQLRQFRIAHCT